MGGIDVFTTDNAQSTVTLGGATAPASGTVETWVLATPAAFTASSAATPPSQFRGADPAFPSETLLCSNLSGSTATIVRGAEGTTPVAHQPGFTLRQVISKGTATAFRVAAWINVVTDFGADNTGATDASAAINAAILACPPGGVVYCPYGIYLLQHPIVIQAGITFAGDHGATSSGDDAASFLGTIFRVSATFTNPAWGAFDTAAILCLDQTPGTGGATKGIRLRDFWVDGSLSTVPNVDGIDCYGPINSWQAMNVGVYKVTGNGWGWVQPGGGEGNPDGQHLYNCLAQSCGGEGFTGELLDATLVDCHAQGNGSNGFHLLGGNVRFVACRSDLSGGDGWVLDHSGAGDGYSDAITLDSCGTQRNAHNGVRITNSSAGGTGWHDPVFITGCSFGEDGANGGAGGGGYAGIRIEGQNIVHIANTLIAVGTVDVGSGCPQYGVATATVSGGAPQLVTVTGGRIEAVSNLTNDAAGLGTALRISPDTEGAIGYQSGTILSRQSSATLSAGTVTVSSPWVTTTSRIQVSIISTSGAPSGFAYLSARTQTSSPASGGTFTIKSTVNTDTYSVLWTLLTQ